MRFGSSWVYAPGRWNTVDGCVPIRVVWAYFAAISMANALDAITTARGINLAFGGNDAASGIHEKTLAEAFPASPAGAAGA